MEEFKAGGLYLYRLQWCESVETESDSGQMMMLCFGEQHHKISTSE